MLIVENARLSWMTLPRLVEIAVSDVGFAQLLKETVQWKDLLKPVMKIMNIY